jgi:hypothetical protein
VRNSLSAGTGRKHIIMLLGKELKDYIDANPAKSIYCFTLNRKKPGHFNIVFKANPSSPVQVWVR